MIISPEEFEATQVAFHPEGVDRNQLMIAAAKEKPRRLPPGGRG